jgi:hypothetical protein
VKSQSLNFFLISSALSHRASGDNFINKFNASVVLPAPGAGAGTYHFFVMQALLLFGVAKEDGIAYATMVHGIQMIVLLVIGAIASLLVIAKQKKQANEQA